MIISSLISIRLIPAIAKEMVNWELAKRVIPNLYYAGEKIVQNTGEAIQYHLQYNEHGKKSPESNEQPNSTEYLVHNKLEALFAWFQVIVLWHDPYNTLMALGGLLTSFLLLTYSTPSFYAIIMIALFVYNLTRLWFRHIWPEIRVPPEEGKEEEARLDVNRWTYLHPDLMSLNEFGQITSNLIKASENYISQLILLRREKPIKFCLIICSILSCTAFIGNRISDLNLIFLIVTALVLAPGIYLYLLPNSAKLYLKNYMNISTNCVEDDIISKKTLVNDIEEEGEEEVEEGRVESEEKKEELKSQKQEDEPVKKLLIADSANETKEEKLEKKYETINNDDEIDDDDDEQHDGFVIL